MMSSFAPRSSRNDATNRSSLHTKASIKRIVDRLYSPAPRLESARKTLASKEPKLRLGKKKATKVIKLDVSERSLSARPTKPKQTAKKQQSRTPKKVQK